MKYLVPLVLFLTSCAGIQEVSHPIDEQKQQELLLSESPVGEVDLFNVSILAFIVLILLVGLWFLAWKKTQKSVEGDSSST